MGISKGGLRLLLDETKAWPFYGRVLQLGRQGLFFKQNDVTSLAALHGVSLNTQYVEKNKNQPLMLGDYLDDGSFFAQLGFSQVESMDFSSDESPTFVHDLNEPVPRELVDKYDTIYNGGTMEHVFDTRSVLKNIFEMLHVGGRVIHISPSSNAVDHGFYSFSPTLFYDYYLANKYKIHEILLIEYSEDHNDAPWSIYEYDPGCLEDLWHIFANRKILCIYMTAEKTPESTCDQIPMQSRWTLQWKDKDVRLASPERVRSRARLSERKPPNLLQKLLKQHFHIDHRTIPNKIAEY